MSCKVTNEFLMKLFTRSTIPLAHGDATAIFRCLIARVSTNFSNSKDVKAVPLFVTILDGFLKREKIPIKCFITFLVVVALTGHNQVNLMKASTTTNMCLYVMIARFL